MDRISGHSGTPVFNRTNPIPDAPSSPESKVEALRVAIAEAFEKEKFSSGLLKAFETGIGHCSAKQKLKALFNLAEVAVWHAHKDSPQPTSGHVNGLRAIAADIPAKVKIQLAIKLAELRDRSPTILGMKWLNVFEQMLGDADAEEPHPYPTISFPSNLNAVREFEDAGDLSDFPADWKSLCEKLSRIDGETPAARELLNRIYAQAQKVDNEQQMEALLAILEVVNLHISAMPPAGEEDVVALRKIAAGLSLYQHAQFVREYEKVFQGRLDAKNMPWSAAL